MNIIGGDFNLKKDSGTFILYIKNKNGKPKLEGYFTNVYYAFKRIYNWRKGKKYPHKEDPNEMLSEMRRYRAITKKLDDYRELVYAPVYKLNNEVNGTRGVHT